MIWNVAVQALATWSRVNVVDASSASLWLSDTVGPVLDWNLLLYLVLTFSGWFIIVYSHEFHVVFWLICFFQNLQVCGTDLDILCAFMLLFICVYSFYNCWSFLFLEIQNFIKFCILALFTIFKDRSKCQFFMRFRPWLGLTMTLAVNLKVKKHNKDDSKTADSHSQHDVFEPLSSIFSIRVFNRHYTCQMQKWN